MQKIDAKQTHTAEGASDPRSTLQPSLDPSRKGRGPAKPKADTARVWKLIAFLTTNEPHASQDRSPVGSQASQAPIPQQGFLFLWPSWMSAKVLLPLAAPFVGWKGHVDEMEECILGSARATSSRQLLFPRPNTHTHCPPPQPTPPAHPCSQP